MMQNIIFFFILALQGFHSQSYVMSDFKNVALQSSNPITVEHSIEGNQHMITFPNQLQIPKENYAKFFHRMKNVYPEIMAIEEDEGSSSFTLFFENKLPESTRLNEILNKFSLRNYSILKS